ncbi:MAG: DUF2723 domain-containing protein [Candidatus Nitrohelix vancouverensis]|uniref:DUF2723 domain-containing protein n=1 Tax=Candidatus Nitrohelix vancouverensis TaxID=2705534 RepID=A0A7T0C0W8_9BACT|nr:MAG: DUF2723 domain-containing protein [Candidatus Nitrohelix vancouverensis]
MPGNAGPTIVALAALFFIPWLIYLSSLSPTVGFKDSPEFIDTAYMLGISHPAGFPTYNLTAKAATFIPLGSIAFRVNAVSAFIAALTLSALFLASLKFLQICQSAKETRTLFLSALAPSTLLAFALPFWSNAVKAEVYSLNAFFIVVLMYLLFLWKERGDARFLFAAAFLYGLSAGNHATVGMYLPAIVALYFFWKREAAPGSLTACVALFLLGLSVYLYLPIRSLAEPSFDWGNPETLSGFFYQVTDRKDSGVHFSAFREATGAAGMAWFSALVSFFSGVVSATAFFIKDIAMRFSPLMVAGAAFGGWMCWKRRPALLIFFLLIVLPNAGFFKGWGGESFFPSYIVVALLSSLALSEALERMQGYRTDKESVSEKPVLNWARMLVLILAVWIGTRPIVNFPQADRSEMYAGETLLKPIFLALPDDSIFLAGISWFHFFYHNDVERLRDDVTGVRAWDFLEKYPPEYLTKRRFPDLILPDASAHVLDSRLGAWNYLQDFMKSNASKRTIVTDQNLTFFKEFPLDQDFSPSRSVMMAYGGADDPEAGRRALEEFKRIVERELSRPGIAFEKNWINKIAYYFPSFAAYFRQREQWDNEREALKVMHDFLGVRDAPWFYKMTSNLIADGRAQDAQGYLERMEKKFPGQFETLMARAWLLRAEQKTGAAIEIYQDAADLRPEASNVYLEMAKTLALEGRKNEALEALEQSRARAVNLYEWSEVDAVSATLP